MTTDTLFPKNTVAGCAACSFFKDTSVFSIVHTDRHGGSLTVNVFPDADSGEYTFNARVCNISGHYASLTPDSLLTFTQALLLIFVSKSPSVTPGKPLTVTITTPFSKINPSTFSATRSTSTKDRPSEKSHTGVDFSSLLFTGGTGVRKDSGYFTADAITKRVNDKYLQYVAPPSHTEITYNMNAYRVQSNTSGAF